MNQKNTSKALRYDGALIWLNDIEVNIVAYLGSMLLLVAAMILIRLPLFVVTMPIGDPFEITVSQISGFGWVKGAITIANLAAIFMLVFPMLKLFEWKYIWFAPVNAIFGAELGVMAYLFIKQSDIAENSLAGFAMDLLSMEMQITGTGFCLVAILAIGVAASIVMLLDIRKNKSIYMYE